MKTKKMYALEYKSYDGNRTFDIFETIKDAKKYAEKIITFGYQYAPLYIFKTDFNFNRIYKESDVWNYEDYSDIFNFDEIKILKHYDL